MTRNKHWTVIIAAVAVLALGAAGQAFARGPRGQHGDGPDGMPPGPAVGHFDRHLLDQLIYPCQTACMEGTDGYRDCVDAANAAFLACVETPCTPQVTAAQTACKGASRTQACWDATTALNTCVLSQTTCVSTQAGAVATCTATLQTCNTACTSSN